MYPLPERELERLGALRSLHIMDSAPAPEFDAVVTLVRDALQVPIALVSLVDSDRQWFKARCGVTLDGTARSVAFCSHAVMSEEVFTVVDARVDPRFSDNPLVTGPPHLRFYAGAPIVMAPGLAIGTLCAMGPVPRVLTAAESELLARLAQMVGGLIRGHGRAVEAASLARESGAQDVVLREQVRALQVHERRLWQTGRVAGVGWWELDLRTGAIVWSEETYRLHGVAPGETLDVRRALAPYPRRERVRIRRLIEAAASEGAGYDEVFALGGEGEARRLRTLGDVETVDGAPVRLFGIVTDVSERQVAQGVPDPALRDGLTGLANRRRFDALLEQACVAPGASPGMLLVGVSDCRETNHTLGHDAGDALITGVAQRLSRAVGAGGQVARVAGDEFAVLLPSPSDAGMLDAVAGRILAEMRPALPYKVHSLKPGVSIGGAMRGRGRTAGELRQCADLAFQHAKTARRGGLVLFHERLRRAAQGRARAVAMVDAALVEGRLVAYYQPVIALATGEVSGLEALARVVVGDEVLSIGAFAEALHDPRTATRVTARMLERIEADVVAWRAAGGVAPRIAFNVGMADFEDLAFEPMVEGIFGRTGLLPSQFALEVTETVFLSESTGRVAAAAGRLRAKGMVVALDDFGTGHASLTHLGSFPVDVVKMDSSFLRRLMDGGRGAVITASLIELAHRLGLEVIAEGVETWAQFRRVRELGCEKMQGYLFSPAVPAEAAMRFVREFRMPEGASGLAAGGGEGFDGPPGVGLAAGPGFVVETLMRGGG